MTLRAQLLISFSYCIGVLLTFIRVHRFTRESIDEGSDPNIGAIVSSGRLPMLYCVWAFAAVLWPATWTFVLTQGVLPLLRMRFVARCLRAPRARCRSSELRARRDAEWAEFVKATGGLPDDVAMFAQLGRELRSIRANVCPSCDYVYARGGYCEPQPHCCRHRHLPVDARA